MLHCNITLSGDTAMTALRTSHPFFLTVSDEVVGAARLSESALASTTEAAGRTLDLWAEALTCAEMLAVAALQSGRDSAQALQNGLLQSPPAGCGGTLPKTGLEVAGLCWSVLEAALLPYRDLAGRFSIRLAPAA